MRNVRKWPIAVFSLLFLFSAPYVWAKGQNSSGESSGSNGPTKKPSSSGGAVTAPGIGGAPELVIGEERVEPGIVFIFEGAIKDTVYPLVDHLSEDQTNIHIEARSNWDTDNLPEGTPPEGFVAYLEMTAEIMNQSTGYKTFVDLVPHINLIDNLHYARNIALPGKLTDLYTIKFTVTSPVGKGYVSIHKDWKENYGDALMEPVAFIYTDVDFKVIAEATRG